MHLHDYSHSRTYTTLALPDSSGRYELLTVHHCACGDAVSSTSWSKSRGRHITYREARLIRDAERARPQQRKAP